MSKSWRCSLGVEDACDASERGEGPEQGWLIWLVWTDHMPHAVRQSPRPFR